MEDDEYDEYYENRTVTLPPLPEFTPPPPPATYYTLKGRRLQVRILIFDFSLFKPTCVVGDC